MLSWCPQLRLSVSYDWAQWLLLVPVEEVKETKRTPLNVKSACYLFLFTPLSLVTDTELMTIPSALYDVMGCQPSKNRPIANAASFLLMPSLSPQ